MSNRWEILRDKLVERIKEQHQVALQSFASETPYGMRKLRTTGDKAKYFNALPLPRQIELWNGFDENERKDFQEQIAPLLDSPQGAGNYGT